MRRVSNGKATTVTVKPEVWEKAYRLAGGEFRRLQVVSPTEVIVWNTVEQRREHK